MIPGTLPNLSRIAGWPTSLAETRVNEFVEVDSTFVIDQPQHGLMRVAVAGAFSNGGTVSGTLTIERHREKRSTRYSR